MLELLLANGESHVHNGGNLCSLLSCPSAGGRLVRVLCLPPGDDSNVHSSREAAARGRAILQSKHSKHCRGGVYFFEELGACILGLLFNKFFTSTRLVKCFFCSCFCLKRMTRIGPCRTNSITKIILLKVRLIANVA